MQSRFLKRIGMFAFGLAMSHAVVYLGFAYANWEAHPLLWTAGERSFAALFSWGFGLMAGLALALEGVK